jgi:hypothetical protein
MNKRLHVLVGLFTRDGFSDIRSASIYLLRSSFLISDMGSAPSSENNVPNGISRSLAIFAYADTGKETLSFSIFESMKTEILVFSLD